MPVLAEVVVFGPTPPGVTSVCVSHIKRHSKIRFCVFGKKKKKRCYAGFSRGGRFRPNCRSVCVAHIKRHSKSGFCVFGKEKALLCRF